MLSNSFSHPSFHMQCCILPMLPSLIPYAMPYIPNYTPSLHMPCCTIVMPPNLILYTMLFPIPQHIIQYKTLYIFHTVPSHSTCHAVFSLFPLPHFIYHAVYSLFSNTSFNLPCWTLYKIFPSNPVSCWRCGSASGTYLQNVRGYASSGLRYLKYIVQFMKSV